MMCLIEGGISGLSSGRPGQHQLVISRIEHVDATSLPDGNEEPSRRVIEENLAGGRLDDHVAKQLVATCVDDADTAIIKSGKLGPVAYVKKFGRGVVEHTVCAELQLEGI